MSLIWGELLAAAGIPDSPGYAEASQAAAELARAKRHAREHPNLHPPAEPGAGPAKRGGRRH